jgi:hypothetical protein
VLVVLLGLSYASKELPGLNGEWENDSGALLAGNNPKCTEIAKLHRLRAFGEDVGGLEQLLRRLLLSFGIDNLGTPLAFGFRLAGDS